MTAPAKGAAPTASGRLREVLRALSVEPLTPAELCARLGSPQGVVDGMIRTLLLGRYVQEAAANRGDCGCTTCNVKSLCRAADQETPALSLLRLTERGERYLWGERLPMA